MMRHLNAWIVSISFNITHSIYPTEETTVTWKIKTFCCLLCFFVNLFISSTDTLQGFSWFGTEWVCGAKKISPCNLTNSKKRNKNLRGGIHNSENYGWWNLAKLAEEFFIFLKRFASWIGVKISPERTYLKSCCSCIWLRTYYPDYHTQMPFLVFQPLIETGVHIL